MCTNWVCLYFDFCWIDRQLNALNGQENAEQAVQMYRLISHYAVADVIIYILMHGFICYVIVSIFR